MLTDSAQLPPPTLVNQQWRDLFRVLWTPWVWFAKQMLRTRDGPFGNSVSWGPVVMSTCGRCGAEIHPALQAHHMLACIMAPGVLARSREDAFATAVAAGWAVFKAPAVVSSKCRICLKDFSDVRAVKRHEAHKHYELLNMVCMSLRAGAGGWRGSAQCRCCAPACGCACVLFACVDSLTHSRRRAWRLGIAAKPARYLPCLRQCVL